MPSSGNSAISPLDKIRIKNGIEELKAQFNTVLKKSHGEAANLINDKRLYFTTLFLLLPEIDNANLYGELASRNLLAIKVCAIALRDPGLESHVQPAGSDNEANLKDSLKWILKTGAANDGLSDDFEQVLDSAAAMLIKNHKDTELMPLIAEMIFKRNKRGGLIHDLVWAYFQQRDPKSLRTIARFLLSDNTQDVHLAAQLLHLPQTGGTGRSNDRQRQYNAFLSWLNENEAYMYASRESFQCSSEPNAYEVDLNAKYLCKRISPLQTGLREEHLTAGEKKRLDKFKMVREQDRETLSAFSNQMYRRNPQAWQRWIERTSAEQIRMAKNSGQGGLA